MASDILYTFLSQRPTGKPSGFSEPDTAYDVRANDPAAPGEAAPSELSMAERLLDRMECVEFTLNALLDAQQEQAEADKPEAEKPADALERRLERIEASLEALCARPDPEPAQEFDLSPILARLDSISETANTAVQLKDELLPALERLEEQVASADAVDFAPVTASIETLREEQSRTHDALSAMNARVETALDSPADVPRIPQIVEALGPEIEARVAPLKDLERAIQALQSASSQQDEELSSEIKALGQSIASAQDQVMKGVATGAEAHEARIDALQTTLLETASNEKLLSALSEMMERLEKVASRPAPKIDMTPIHGSMARQTVVLRTTLRSLESVAQDLGVARAAFEADGKNDALQKTIEEHGVELNDVISRIDTSIDAHASQMTGASEHIASLEQAVQSLSERLSQIEDRPAPQIDPTPLHRSNARLATIIGQAVRRLEDLSQSPPEAEDDPTKSEITRDQTLAGETAMERFRYILAEAISLQLRADDKQSREASFIRAARNTSNA